MAANVPTILHLNCVGEQPLSCSEGLIFGHVDKSRALLIYHFLSADSSLILFFIPQFVFTLFWSIYAYDRELIHPERLDKLIPVELNLHHHAGIMVTSIIEILIVFHRYPSNFRAYMIQFLVTTLYLFWTVWVFSVTSKWSYPFMEKIPLPIFPVFCAINLMIYVAFYYVGKLLCYFRWRGKGSDPVIDSSY